MAFVLDAHKREYAPNTRETFRRQVLHQFVQARIADYNPDNPSLPVNSPKAHYAITKDALEVSLSNVSYDYFNYVTMRLENQLALAELFSEPVYYATNIRGGRGFFTLHMTDVRVIVLY